jgi:hypothetical protein
MTPDDRETLWAWVQSSSGRDDLPAWKRLLAQLDFRDPRRSLAAAQIQSRRTAYAGLIACLAAAPRSLLPTNSQWQSRRCSMTASW